MKHSELPGRVLIFMATRDGARFLEDQLASLEAQTHPSIDILASDDGSTDTTMVVLKSWQDRWTKGTISIVEGPRKGFAENFRSLLCTGAIDAPFFAFCDQDDVWQPDKLTRAVNWLGPDGDTPKLFCSRTRLVAEDGSDAGYSPLFSRPPSFRNALVQSIAGGNTMVWNRATQTLLARASERSGFVSHDWWAYLLVTGAGGAVRYEAAPLVRYRQHPGNTVGENTSIGARMARLRNVLHGQFADWTDENVSGLDLNADLLTADARADFERFRDARKGGALTRLRGLHDTGVYRQSTLGDVGLYLAALAGRL